jgi:hypothetical protein
MQHSATLHHTSLHFATLHPTTLHYSSLPLIYTSLPFHLASHVYISYLSISHHITRHSTDLIPKLMSKIINLFTALKNHFTSLLLLLLLILLLLLLLLSLSLFLFLSLFFFSYPINPTLHFTLLFLTTTYFPSLFTFYRLYFPSMVCTFLTLVFKICVLPWEVPIAPSGSLFQSVMVLFTKEYFPISVLCFLALIFQ